MTLRTKTDETASSRRRKGGRPSQAEAAALEDKILDAAAAVFFRDGYGAVSVEKIVAAAHISKRTFYARFEDKAALFRAVVHRIVARLRPSDTATDALFEGINAETILRRIAPIILKAALTPEALAMQRLMLAEAARFPELALIMNQQGARQEAINRIAEVLKRAIKKGHHLFTEPHLAAEQFLVMVTAAPQRRAMGLGTPLTAKELEIWADQAVDIFLKGCWKK